MKINDIFENWMANRSARIKQASATTRAKNAELKDKYANLSEEEQLALVAKKGGNIRLFSTPSEKVMLAAIAKDSMVIKSIAKIATDAVWKAFLARSNVPGKWVFDYVDNKKMPEWVVDYILKKYPETIFQAKSKVTNEQLKDALVNPELINLTDLVYAGQKDRYPYDTFVKIQFAKNTVLIAKWLRYAETIRDN